MPDAFLNGQKLLMASVHKLFNGLTKFGLYKKALRVGLLMDDAHACSDIIVAELMHLISCSSCKVIAPKSIFMAEPCLNKSIPKFPTQQFAPIDFKST